MTDIGKELLRTGSKANAINSQASSTELRAWVAGEYQILREMLPGPLPSKEADALALDMLEAMAQEIGVGAFHAMILKAIETCERRPTIATLRRIAGLNDRLDAQQMALAEAWASVTRVVTKHVGRDGEGHAILQPRIYRDGDVFREEPVPNIPTEVLQAVRSMGGWGALADSYPAFWGMRFANFKEFFVGSRVTSLAKNQS